MHLQGPLHLGDPSYRGLSKMEEDPLITQRLRDNARTSLCKPHTDRFSKCAKERVRRGQFFFSLPATS